MSENVIIDTTADYIKGSRENLELALTVEEALPAVKKELRGRFWSALFLRLEKGLKEAGSDEKWRIEEDPTDTILRGLEKPYAGLQAAMREDRDKNRVVVGIWQDRGTLALYHGVTCTGKKPTTIMPEFEELRGRIEKTLGRTTPWQVGWEWTDNIVLNEKCTLVRLASAPEEPAALADQVSKKVLRILEDHGECIAAADAALARA